MKTEAAKHEMQLIKYQIAKDLHKYPLMTVASHPLFNRYIKLSNFVREKDNIIIRAPLDDTFKKGVLVWLYVGAVLFSIAFVTYSLTTLIERFLKLL